MTVASEYRQYAAECMDSARSTDSDEAQKQFLDIAKLWLMAADHLDRTSIHRVNESWLLDGHAPPIEGVTSDGSS